MVIAPSELQHYNYWVGGGAGRWSHAITLASVQHEPTKRMRKCTCLAFLTAWEASIKENGRFSLVNCQPRALCESSKRRDVTSRQPWTKRGQEPGMSTPAPSRLSSQFLETFFTCHRWSCWNRALSGTSVTCTTSFYWLLLLFCFTALLHAAQETPSRQTIHTRVQVFVPGLPLWEHKFRYWKFRVGCITRNTGCLLPLPGLAGFSPCSCSWMYYQSLQSSCCWSGAHC